MLYLGSHISAEGKNGIINAIKHAEKINANALQIFISNRVGKGTKSVDDKMAEDIKELLHKNKTILIIHSPYVLNFAKEFDETSWWINLCLKELEIAHRIGAIGCVIHMGKFLQLNTDTAHIYWMEAIKYIASKVIEKKWSAFVILETPAGQGTEMYTTLETFCNMYKSFTVKEKEVIKVCIDTCHIYSSGYEVMEYIDNFTKKVGIENLCLIHLNDSKKPKGSCVDRHENIGQGYIGTDTIKHVVQFGKKYSIPLILETPDDTLHKDEIKNITS